MLYSNSNKQVLANKDASPFLCCIVVVVVVVVFVIMVVVVFLDANETSLITLVHYLSLEIGNILNFNQFKECISDGQADGQTDGLTDYPSSRDSRKPFLTIFISKR